MRALAVFHNKGNHWADRWLKSGFRHVFVCVHDGEYWIRTDGQVGVPTIEVVAEGDYDLATYYRTYPEENMTVVETIVGNQMPRWPLTVNNCVGLAKVVLGVRCMAFTPYQLYCHLRLQGAFTALYRHFSLPGKAMFAPSKPKFAKAPPPALKVSAPVVQEAGNKARVAELERAGRRAAIFTSGQGVEEELGIVSRPRARAAQVMGQVGA